MRYLLTFLLSLFGTTASGQAGKVTPILSPAGTVAQFYKPPLKATDRATHSIWPVMHCTGKCAAGVDHAFSGTPSEQIPIEPAPSGIIGPGATGSAITPPNNLYVATDGSDSNPCTEFSPCATPDYAFNNLARPGDTVWVAAGVYSYTREVHFTSSGSSGHYITLACATRGACTITNNVTGNSTVIEMDGDYQTINGFVITNTGPGNNLGIYVTASFINITQNIIHGIRADCFSKAGGGGIQLADRVSHITIDSNLVYDIDMPGGIPVCPADSNNIDGIIAESIGSSIVITNNIVYWTSGGWGILLGPGNGGGGNEPTDQISNNLIFKTARGGIVLLVGGVYVTNNIIIDNGTQTGSCAIQNVSGLSENYYNSELYNNNGGNYCRDLPPQ